MNIVIGTNGEWQAFELVLEVLRQKRKTDRLIVWADSLPDHWASQMRDLAEIRQHRITDSMADHYNMGIRQFPENEWVIRLDADERIQPGFLDAVKARAALETDADAMMVERRNSYWHETGSVVPPQVDYSMSCEPDFQPRVLRNCPYLYLVRPVHQHLVGAKKIIHLTGPPFTLIHHRKDCPRGYERLVPNYVEYCVNECKLVSSGHI